MIKETESIVRLLESGEITEVIVFELSDKFPTKVPNYIDSVDSIVITVNKKKILIQSFNYDKEIYAEPGLEIREIDDKTFDTLVKYYTPD